MIIDMDEPDNRRQEQDELEQFLDDLERQKLKDIDQHMQRAFKEIFGGDHAEK